MAVQAIWGIPRIAAVAGAGRQRDPRHDGPARRI